MRGDFVAVAEAGVILKTLQDAVEEQGLYYPPDPASRADCSVGGTVATNAGGPRCLKYGVTRDYVLGLQAVLADGTVRRAGRAHAQEQNGVRLDAVDGRFGRLAGRGHGSHFETHSAAAVSRVAGGGI